MSAQDQPITVSLVVGQDQRSELLSKYFGTRLAARGEALVFAWLLRLCKIPIQWTSLQYYTLSNGGFYLAPTFGGSESKLSADASGIVATLLTLRQLAHESAGTPLAATFARHYHSLAAFSISHPEKIGIYREID
ncbi:antirestriction protein [Xanthomonas albilineans]|uniref:antirestriction protein n=1 Tax=Xanthomonas albilineans TaxID=29447 RepID=UPI0009BB2268|nr:antirestriction protein [Xanthomonas albilineans]